MVMNKDIKAIQGSEIKVYLPVYKLENGNEVPVDFTSFDDVEVIIAYENGIDPILRYKLSESQLSIHEVGVLELKIAKNDTFKVICETSKRLEYSVIFTVGEVSQATNQQYLLTMYKQASSTL